MRIQSNTFMCALADSQILYSGLIETSVREMLPEDRIFPGRLCQIRKLPKNKTAGYYDGFGRILYDISRKCSLTTF